MAFSTGTNVVIISIVFSLLAIALVLVRFQSRTNQRVGFGPDDYLIVPATFLTVGVGIANSISQSGPFFLNKLFIPDSEICCCCCVYTVRALSWAPTSKLRRFLQNI